VTGVLLGAIAALVVGMGVSWLISHYAGRLGLLDIPNARSSHRTPTPRGGGLGVIAGVLVGFVVMAFYGVYVSRDVAIVLAAWLLIAILGVVDDLRQIGIGYRLAMQAVVAIALVILIGGVNRLPLPPPADLPVGLLGLPLTVLWVVVVTNFYNFMDGIDGLAGGQAIASCVGIALASWTLATTDLAIVLAAASLGFLTQNFPRARIFLGDVGSTSIGFLLSVLPLLAPLADRSMALLAVAIGLALFLLDPIETLFRLARGGRRLGVAHREHAYQHLANTQNRYNAVAISLVSAGLVLSLAGALAFRNVTLGWPALALAIAAYALERFLSGRARSSARRAEHRV
jgi:Fuc2NAc and GlcNAc transferase